MKLRTIICLMPIYFLHNKKLTLPFRKMKPNLSIIIPAYEEQARLGESVGKILAYIEKEKLNAELIVVDDGSKDKTAEVAEKACAEFPDINTKVIRYEKNRGKGYAVKTGMLAAARRHRTFFGCRLSTPISELPKLVEPIKNGEL